jgi:hypothetical protein
VSQIHLAVDVANAPLALDQVGPGLFMETKKAEASLCYECSDSSTLVGTRRCLVMQSRTPLPEGRDRNKELVQTCQFDAGQLTSDGGVAWVHQADAALGLCAALAAQVPEWRRGPVRHGRETLIRQRI